MSASAVMMPVAFTAPGVVVSVVILVAAALWACSSVTALDAAVVTLTLCCSGSSRFLKLRPVNGR